MKYNNQQAVFDHVASHLAQQKVCALVLTKNDTGYGGYCQLRGDNNTSCAVGCLIPDDEYMPEMEALSSLSVVAKKGPLFEWCVKNVAPELMPLIKSLQRVHDSGHEWWSDNLQKCAKENQLEFDQRAFDRHLAQPVQATGETA